MRRPRPDLIQRCVQLVPIVGEVERSVAGCRVNRCAGPRLERLLQYTLRRFARLRQIAEAKMHIVKEPHDEMPGDGLRRPVRGSFRLGISVRIGFDARCREEWAALRPFRSKTSMIS